MRKSWLSRRSLRRRNRPARLRREPSRRLRGDVHRDHKKITGRMGEVSGQSVKGENGI